MKTKSFIFLITFFSIYMPNISIFAADEIPSINVAQLMSGGRTLKVGYIADFPPFYFPGTKSLEGLDISVFAEVAKRAGFKKLEYLNFKDFSDLNQALQVGKIDIIVNDYWDIPEYKKLFLMTIPYYLRDGIAFIFLKEKYDFKTLEDLRGYKIGVFESETDVIIWLKKNPIPQAILTIYDTREKFMQALAENKMDVGFVHYTDYLFHANKKKYPFTGVLIEHINSVFAVRFQDMQLQKTLNKALKSMWADESLYKIKKKYLGSLGIEPARWYTR